MNITLTNRDETLNESQMGTLEAEQFLQDKYLFRRNVLSGKVEFTTLPSEGTPDGQPVWRVLTQEALNSIVIRAKRENVGDGVSPKPDIVELLHSEEVRAYDPIRE